MLEMATMCALTVLFSGQRLSNSFIIAEGDVAHFIIASLYCFYMIRALSSPSRQNSHKHVWKMFSYAHIAIFLTSITGLQTTWKQLGQKKILFMGILGCACHAICFILEGHKRCLH